MKLFIKFAFLALIFTLIALTSQSKMNKAESESRFLFDMWKNVPGASSEPNFIERKVRHSRRGPKPAAAPAKKASKSSASKSSWTAETITSNFNEGFSKLLAEGWLEISSPIFKDESKFPVFKNPDGTSDILTSPDYTRINEKFVDSPVTEKIKPKSKDPNTPPGRTYFWFRMSTQFLYFAENKQCVNILGTVDFKNQIEPSSVHFVSQNCFKLSQKTGNTFKLCAEDNEKAKKFLCQIQTTLRIEPDEYCAGKKPTPVPSPQAPALEPGQLVEKIVNQPYILVPLAREMCNENWNYAKHGKDWKCLCKEGLEQSPLNLPPTEKAIGSPVKALFNFDKIPKIADEDFEDKVKSGDNLQLQYYEGALRIFAAYLGKTVTMDGGVYYAQQISFHTPSEHRINGEEFPLEMQITHVGKTIGDTAKHMVLSFLFKKSPGIYNKFIEGLDFFNLPNPLDKVRDLEKSIFLPNIFFQTNEEGKS